MSQSHHYLEDLEPGRVFGSRSYTVTDDEVRQFATAYDPQPFHLDHDAARDSFFGGLAASGWHTAAITMRLLVEGELRPAGGMIGAGVDELKWHRPVRPGDCLRVRTEILETRPMRSRTDRGLAKMRVTTLDQAGEPVQSFLTHVLVPRRTAD
jgi:acyl dehydratase